MLHSIPRALLKIADGIATQSVGTEYGKAKQLMTQLRAAIPARCLQFWLLLCQVPPSVVLLTVFGRKPDARTNAEQSNEDFSGATNGHADRDATR